MNREGLIEQAAIAMAGLAWVGAGPLERATWRTYAKDAVAAVAPLIAAAERERCAKVADEVATLRSVPSNKWVASEIATAIRALGDTP